MDTLTYIRFFYHHKIFYRKARYYKVFNFIGVKINKLIIHSVGNKVKENSIVLSQKCVDLSNESLHDILGNYFFRRFKDNRLYHFSHETNLTFNEIYQYVKAIFDDLNSFEVNSQNIAKHLYEASKHPNIKTGELCVAYIKGAVLNEVEYDAIGIFKSESKDPFLKIKDNKNDLTVDWEQGIDTNKLDKGCIVFNNQVEKGYKVLLVDSGSSLDTKYWKEDFLGIQISNNDFNKTKILVEACKEFVKKDYNGDKLDKITLLNNAVEYIETTPRIDLDTFTSRITKDLEHSSKLKEFINDFAEKKECKDIITFSTDNYAVQNIKKSIRNFIKLDTDIEIKIKSSTEDNNKYLERGYDEEKNMYFYKLYFNEEK